MRKNDSYNHVYERLELIRETAMKCDAVVDVRFTEQNPNRYDEKAVIFEMVFSNQLLNYMKVWATINFDTREVYQIDMESRLGPTCYYSWYNEYYINRVNSVNSKVTKVENLESIMRLIANGSTVEDPDPYPDTASSEEREESEVVELALNDSELAQIARAAHMKDMTINEFVNDAIRCSFELN